MTRAMLPILVILVVGCVLGAAASSYLYTVGTHVERNIKMTATVMHSGVSSPILNVTWISPDMSYDFQVVMEGATDLKLTEAAAGKPMFFESSEPLMVTVKIEKGPSNAGSYRAPLVQNSNTLFINDEISRATKRAQGMTIVCTQELTEIEVTYHNKEKEKIPCNRLEKLVLESKGEANLPVKVSSSQPIGVFSFHDCAPVPKFPGTCDALMSTLPPVTALDRKYVIPPVGGRSNDTGYIIQVVSAEPNTVATVYYDDLYNTTTLVNDLEYTQFDVTPNVASVVKCSKPCMVKQYNKGRNVGGLLDHLTDGYSLEIAPPKEYSWILTFTPGDNETFVNYLSIVAHVMDGHPKDMVDLSDYEVFHPWSLVPNVEDHYTTVIRIDRLVQVMIVSENPSMKMAGYHSSHHVNKNTAYAALVAVQGVDRYPGPTAEWLRGYSNGGQSYNSINNTYLIFQACIFILYNLVQKEYLYI